MKEMMNAKRELEREADVRRVVYPRLIGQGKLTQDEADNRLHNLRMAIYVVDQAITELRLHPKTTGGPQ